MALLEPIYVGRACYTKDMNFYNFYVKQASDLGFVYSWAITMFEHARKEESTNIVSINSPLDNMPVDNMAEPIIPYLMTRQEARKIYLERINTPYIERAKLHVANCIKKLQMVQPLLDNFDPNNNNGTGDAIYKLALLSEIDISNVDKFLNNDVVKHK